MSNSMKWLGWLGWSIDHTVPSSLLVAWIIHSSVVRRNLFQEAFFWKPTSYVDAYRKEKAVIFFLKKKCSSKIPALQIQIAPPQPVQKPCWNWSFFQEWGPTLSLCRNAASRDIMGCSSGSLTTPMPMATPMPSRGGNFGMAIFWGNKKVVI